MERLTLVYLFVCFSVGLACLGVAVVLALRPVHRVARAFLAFYAFLSLTVFASLLLAFVDLPPASTSASVRAVLEYLEAMVGFYGILFTLPFFAHRVFGVRSARRDRLLLAIVLLAAAVQHVTEYGAGGAWDERGDRLENVIFVAVVAYTLLLGWSKVGSSQAEQPLAFRLLLLGTLTAPAVLYDLLLLEASSLRLYPLAYCALSLVVTWTLLRQAQAREPVPGAAAIPPAWRLSEREIEVVGHLLRGLSNKEIAAALSISSNTVKTHLRSIFDKSGCRSRFALMSRLGGRSGGSEGPAAGSTHPEG